MLTDSDLSSRKLTEGYAAAIDADDVHDALIAELYALVHQVRLGQLRDIGEGKMATIDAVMTELFSADRLSVLQKVAR